MLFPTLAAYITDSGLARHQWLRTKRIETFQIAVCDTPIEMCDVAKSKQQKTAQSYKHEKRCVSVRYTNIKPVMCQS